MPDQVYRTYESELTAVADAIRQAGNTSAELEFPSEFITAIGNISGTTYPDGNDMGYGVDATAPIVGIGKVGSMVLGDQDSPLVGTGQVGLMTI